MYSIFFLKLFFLVFFILRKFVIVAAVGGDGSWREGGLRGDGSLNAFRYKILREGFYLPYSFLTGN